MNFVSLTTGDYNKPWIGEEWPDGNWEALVCNTKQACEAYRKSVLKRGPEGRNIGKLREHAQRSLFSWFRIQRS